MKLAPILTLVTLATAATATHLAYPNPSLEPSPQNHSTCHHVASLTDFVKALPDDDVAMAKALQGLNKVNKMYKWLKCHEENWGVEEDACRKVKEFKKWIERFWTAPAQEWVEEKEGMRDECVDLGALFGCKPKVKGSE